MIASFLGNRSRFLKYCRKIYNTLYYHLHPKGSIIVLNVSVLQWGGHIVHYNIGDDLNIFLLKEITGKKVLSYLEFYHKHSINYMGIGSLLDWLADSQTIVWGSGVQNSTRFRCAPHRVLAVRGPLSKSYLESHNIDCPAVYGDPALLLPLVYSPQNIKKKYKIGLIPHYKDLARPEVVHFCKQLGDNVRLIKFQFYDDWKKTIDSMLECDYILSSSLHGIIISDAYGIPNGRICISNNVAGGDFKYNDYNLSVGRTIKSPITLSSLNSIEDIKKLKSDYVRAHIDLSPLLKCFPFKDDLKPKYKNRVDEEYCI